MNFKLVVFVIVFGFGVLETYAVEVFEVKANIGIEVCEKIDQVKCKRSKIGGSEILTVKLKLDEENQNSISYLGRASFEREFGEEKFKLEVVVYKEVSKMLTSDNQDSVHIWVDAKLSHYSKKKADFVIYNKGGTVVHSQEQFQSFWFRDTTQFETMLNGEKTYIRSTWGNVSPIAE